MGNKLIAKPKLSLQVEESDHILPDESDQIVVDLKQQLAQLKEQLLRYEAMPDASEAPSPTNIAPPQSDSEALEIQLEIKKHQIQSILEKEKISQHRLKILPHVVDHLQKPLSQMTSDLEQLIGSVQDAEVQETLTQCLSVIEGIKHVTESAHRLDEPLHPQKSKIDLLSFFKQITQTQAGKEPIQLDTNSPLPESVLIDEDLFRKSILILLNEISRFSDDVISIRLQQGQETIYDVSVQQLQVSLLGATQWELPPQAEMEAYLSQTLETSEEWGLDVLYAKKIIEAHGGSLSFHHEKQEVVGFKLKLPL